MKPKEISISFIKTASFKAENAKNWKSVCLSILFFLFETAILYLYAIGSLPLILVLLSHVACLALAALLARVSSKKGEDLRYPLSLFLAIFVGGPFGTAGFLLFSCLHPLFCLFSTPFIRWFADLFPEHEQPMANVFDRIQAGWDHYERDLEITPFEVFFQYGTLGQKQAVLDAIAHGFNPLYSPILKQALDDPSNIVRIQAAAIVSKIDLDFEMRLKELLIQLENQSGDEAIFLKLAKHYDAYAYTGLLDRMREKEIQEHAVYFYNAYLKKRPSDPESLLSIGRLFFRMGKYKDVLAWYTLITKELKEVPIGAHSWYLEALFQLKDYHKLAEAAASLKKSEKMQDFSKDVREIIETWGSSAV